MCLDHTVYPVDRRQALHRPPQFGRGLLKCDRTVPAKLTRTVLDVNMSVLGTP